MKKIMGTKAKTALIAAMLVISMVVAQFASLVVPSLAWTDPAVFTIQGGGDSSTFVGGPALNVGYCADHGKPFASSYTMTPHAETVSDFFAAEMLYAYPNMTAATVVNQLTNAEYAILGLAKPAVNNTSYQLATQRIVWTALTPGYVYDGAYSDYYRLIQALANRLLHVPSFNNQEFQMEFVSDGLGTLGHYEVVVTDNNNASMFYTLVGNTPGLTYTSRVNTVLGVVEHVFSMPADMVNDGLVPYYADLEIVSPPNSVGPPTRWATSDTSIQNIYTGARAVTARFRLFFSPNVPPDVELTKESDPRAGSLVTEGTVITYTIRVTNKGRVGFERAFEVWDTIPANTTFVEGSATGGNRVTRTGNVLRWYIDNLNPYDSATLTFKVRVNAMPANSCCTRLISNTAFGSGGQSSNTVVLEQCCVGPTAVKRAVPEHGSIVKEGDTIQYTITVYNPGGEIARGQRIQDIVPDGTTLIASTVSDSGVISNGNKQIDWALADIPAGGQKSVTFSVTVDPLPTGVGYRSLVNRAYRNGLIINDTEHFVYGSTIAGSKKAVPVSGTIVEPGEDITYTITVRNNGAGVARDVVVRDQVPDGTAFVGAGPAATPA
ncbi:MAG: DUF11 domain-containing protein, partial [Oscillospiraceae bacterium]|nr:DUF11 domain-containing protein [Oscillospiraceae bacterium]